MRQEDADNALVSFALMLIFTAGVIEFSYFVYYLFLHL